MTDSDRQQALLEARDAVDRFVARFEPGYRKLACYAALPLVLTPELLNYLRTSFLRGKAPWLAEVDLLLSDLCRPVGYEQYVMDQAVRAYLLSADPQRLTAEERRAAAGTLLGYLRHQERAGPPQRHADAQAQQWSAMAYLDQRPPSGEPAPRELAVHALARSISAAVTAGDRAAQARLAQIVESLRDEIQSYPELLGYARQVAEALAGQTDAVSATSVLGVELAGTPPPVEAPTVARPGGEAPATVETIELRLFAPKQLPDGRAVCQVLARTASGVAEGTFVIPSANAAFQRQIEALARGEGTLATGAQVGEELFRRLVHGEVGTLVQDALGAGPCRILLPLEDSALYDLPWELLADPERGPLGPVDVTGEMPWSNVQLSGWPQPKPPTPIVRSPAQPPPHRPVAAIPPLRVLLTSAMTETKLFGALHTLLTSDEGEFDVVAMPHLSAALLAQERDSVPHIWHFIGSAVLRDGAPALVLRGRDGGPDERGATEIAAILRDVGVRLVVLHAANAESVQPMRALAQRLTAAAPAVIAPQFPMREDDALDFWEALYRALLEGSAVDTAFAAGQQAVYFSSGAQRPGWAALALYTRVLDGRLFERRPAAPAPATAAPAQEAPTPTSETASAAAPTVIREDAEEGRDVLLKQTAAEALPRGRAEVGTPEVRLITAATFRDQGREVPAAYQRLAASADLLWISVPLALVPGPNYSFNKIELSLAFSPAIPPWPIVRAALPNPQTMPRSDAPPVVHVDEQLQFVATRATGRERRAERVEAPSPQNESFADAVAAGRILGPFAYGLRRGRITLGGVGSRRVFWRIESPEFDTMQTLEDIELSVPPEHTIEIVVLLEAPHDMERLRLLAELRVTPSFNWLSAPVSRAIRQLGNSLRDRLSGSEPVATSATFGLTTALEALRQARQGEQPQEGEVEPEVGPLAGASILWVDDRPENNEYERGLLEEDGAHVTRCRSTGEALEAVASARFDVIISDMGRPPDARAGYTLLAALQERGVTTPFIIYTVSSGLEEHREEGRARGMFGVTHRFDELHQLVAAAVSGAPAPGGSDAGSGDMPR